MTTSLNTARLGRVDPGPGYGKQYNYTSDAVLTVSQDGALITNLGATAAVTLSLPPATPGLEFAVLRSAAYDISLEPSGTDRVGNGNPGAARTITGSELAVVSCVVAGTWNLLFDPDGDRNYLNVLSYGADNTGERDTAAELNLANEAARAANKPLLYPPGVYALASPVTILAPPITVVGNSPNSANTGGQQNPSYSVMFKNIGINDTSVSYTGDGTTKDFAVSFPFFLASDLIVTKDGVPVDCGGYFKSSVGGETLIFAPSYATGGGNIAVWKNGTQLTSGVDYTESGSYYFTLAVALSVDDIIQWAIGDQYIVTGGGTYTYGQAPTTATGTVKFKTAPSGSVAVVIKRVNPMILVETVQWGYGYLKMGGFAVDGNYSAGVRNCIGVLARGAEGVAALQSFELFDILAKNCYRGLDLIGYGGLLRNIQTYTNRDIGCLLKLGNAVTIQGGWFDAGVQGAWGFRLQGGNTGSQGTTEHGQGGGAPGSGSTATVFQGAVFQSSVVDSNGLDICEQSNAVGIDTCYFENFAGSDTAGGTLYNPTGRVYGLRAGVLDHLGRTPTDADNRRSQRAVQFLDIKGGVFTGGPSTSKDKLGDGILIDNVQRLNINGPALLSARVVITSRCKDVTGCFTGTDSFGGATDGAHGTTLMYGGTIADETNSLGKPARSFIVNPNNKGAVSGTMRGLKSVSLHAGVTIANETSIIRSATQSLKVTRAASPTFTVNTGTGEVTFSSVPASWANDHVMRFVNVGGALPTGLLADTDYYLKVSAGPVYKFAPTSTNVTITSYASAGTGTHYADMISLPHGLYALPYGQEVLGSAQSKMIAFSGFIRLPSTVPGFSARTHFPAVGLYVNGNIYQHALGFGTTNYHHLDKWVPFMVWNTVGTQSGGYYGFFISPVSEASIPGPNAYSVYVSDLVLCPNPQAISRIMAGEYSMASEAGIMVGDQLIVSAAAAPSDASVSWARGDTVLNSTPAIGSPDRWICTTAGVGGAAVFTATANL